MYDAVCALLVSLSDAGQEEQLKYCSDLQLYTGLQLWTCSVRRCTSLCRAHSYITFYSIPMSCVSKTQNRYCELIDIIQLCYLFFAL